MTWKMRLSIFLSILWLLLTVTIGLSERNGSFIVGMGLAPVLFLWGVWWVITGGKPRPTPILPATEIPKALSTPLMLSPESSRLSQNKSKHFIKRHWRGEYSLSRSYWIHGVLVTVILTLLLTLLGESLDYTTHPWLLVYHLFGVWLFSYIVAIWQLVGTWRSAGNARILEPHSQWPNIAQFLLFMAAISLTIMPFNKAVPQIIGAWEAASEATDSSAYRVIFLNDGTELEINGTFVFGLSDRIQVHLEANPNVKLIHLNSTGGRIAEAKKLRQLIHQKELSTYTSMGCLSACTFAYVGGKSRYLRKGANVGFHRPSFPGIDDTEMQSEVDQLKTAFLKLGVARSFTERVFSTPPNEMWYPSIDDLTSARFVTNITDGGLFGASAYGAYVDRKAAE